MDSISGIGTPTKERGVFVNEIVHTIQGEGQNAGIPVLLVRLQGCNLHCPFCDTESAQPESVKTYTAISDVIARIKEISTLQDVLITGGEPFNQPTRLLGLLYSIRSQLPAMDIIIETNGTIDTPILPCFERLIDYMTVSPKIGNWPKKWYLEWADEVRCLVESPMDIREYDKFLNLQGYDKLRILSPIFVRNAPIHDDVVMACVDWVLKDQTSSYRLSVQLHKILGVR